MVCEFTIQDVTPEFHVTPEFNSRCDPDADPDASIQDVTPMLDYTHITTKGFENICSPFDEMSIEG